MRLLILSQKVDKNDANLGFFHEWIKEFSKHCDYVLVVCLQKGEYSLPENVKVYSLGKEDGESRMKYFFRFYNYIYRERKSYDSVFVHMNAEYVVLGGLFWKFYGKKIGLWYTHKSVDLKLKIATCLADIIFTASTQSFRLKSNKLKVLGHGINISNINNLNSQFSALPFTLISVGRITEVKGYDVIVDAVRIIKEAGGNVRLNIIGAPVTKEDELYLDVLKESIVKKGIGNEVVFIGPVISEKISSYLDVAHVFVHASETGSLDKAPLEAMAREIPVISSSESFKAILDPYGLSFYKGNSTSLSEKVFRLMHSPEERKEIGKKMRHYVTSHHELGKLIKKITDIYS